jgi:superfamily II DNA or RNA helicase
MTKAKPCSKGKIRNPLSNRCIDKKGKLYEKLVKEGKIKVASGSRSRSGSLSPVTSRSSSSSSDISSSFSPLVSSPSPKPIKKQSRKSTGKKKKSITKKSVTKTTKISTRTGRSTGLRKKIKRKQASSESISSSRSSSSTLSSSTSSSRSISPRVAIPSPPKIEVTKSKCLTDYFNSRCIEKSKIPLKDHQKLLVKHISTHRALLAIHSVGSGKTLSAVTASQCFLQENPRGKVIVITPKSLQENFIKEMVQYNPNITNKGYEFYTYDGFVLAKEKDKVDCENVMLIIDEAHNLRTEIGITKPKLDEVGGTEIKGKKSKFILDCAKKAKKVLLLTATPIVNDAYDLANLISMVDGDEVITRTTFRKIMEDERIFNEYFGCKISIFEPNVEETKEFYPRSEVEDVFIRMPEDYEEKYLEVEAGNSTEAIKNPSAFYNGVRRVSNKLDDKKDSPKIQWIREFLEKHPYGKIVFFSHFLDAGVKSIERLLNEFEIPYKHIDGSISKLQRKIAVQDYNSDEIRALIISKAGGEGLNLMSTKYMILMEPSWNPAVAQQVIGRGIRFKSHYHLPKKDQLVEVFKLHLIKRNENARAGKYLDIEKAFEDENPWSVDLYLRALTIYKQKIIKEIIDKLRPLSIENQDCMKDCPEQNLEDIVLVRRKK